MFAVYLHTIYGSETEEQSLEGHTDPYVIDANLWRPLDTWLVTQLHFLQ